MGANSVHLQNDRCSITFDKFGGATTAFRLHDKTVNPLNFSIVHHTAAGIPVEFKGHFLCLGRWGDPSSGEAERSSVKHGDFNRVQWKAVADESTLKMTAASDIDCLSVEREVHLDNSSAIYQVREKVVNFHTIGRLYNMVQHPTIAAPFLDHQTIVDCNCSKGFDYAFSEYKEGIFGFWPEVINTNGQLIRLDQLKEPYNSVFSFVVKPEDEYGWITAFSPQQRLLIGYCWKRSDYPWINHWVHFEEGKILYRGLEFGTTGVHKPFRDIWHAGLLNLLSEQTCSFIDAGESHTRSYYAFLHELPPNFNGVQEIHFDSHVLSIMEKLTGNIYPISHQLNSTDGL